MVSDVATVIWKEWKELIARSSRSRGETVKTIAVAAVILGIIVWRATFFVNNLGSLLVPSFVLVQLLSGLMADSFAGERERHTLETLLASRLSDLAILIGKMVAGVLPVWGLMLFTMGLGTLSAYLRSNGERLPISAGGVGAVLVIYLLVCCVVSCAAALVSLRASTVRQAMQTLTWSFMIVFFAVIFTIARLSVSPQWRVTLLRTLAGEHLLRTEIIAGTILSGLALLLFGAARLRFQRARLILD
jgi:ABC-2 type transport system permease protein